MRDYKVFIHSATVLAAPAVRMRIIAKCESPREAAEKAGLKNGERCTVVIEGVRYHRPKLADLKASEV